MIKMDPQTTRKIIKITSIVSISALLIAISLFIAFLIRARQVGFGQGDTGDE